MWLFGFGSVVGLLVFCAVRRRRDGDLYTRGRTLERRLLALGTVPVVFGLALTILAKSRDFHEISAQISEGRVVDLNDNVRVEKLQAVLSLAAPSSENRARAEGIFEQLRRGHVTHVGSLSRFRSPVVTAGSERDLLFSPSEIRSLKPALIVRPPHDALWTLLRWSVLFVASFWIVHVVWSRLNFRGDQLLLPAAFLLSSLGLIEMISLRDPLRDSQLFVPFVQGILFGCAGMVALSLFNPRDWLGRLAFVPLVGSLVLSILLLVFGSGPGGSDAKVNLGPVQPVEGIRLCLILFLAGYFARKWTLLQNLEEERPRFRLLSKLLALPRLEYLLPVGACVVCALIFFLLQKDLGPALIFACLFLSLYYVARGRAALAVVGLIALVLAFVISFHLGVPNTVVNRVQIFLSPWDNLSRGGDQVAASLWAFASGGTWGAGPGLGDSSSVPAAHTDLILCAVGEEAGLVGVLATFSLWLVLLICGASIADGASTPYEFFLAAGCTIATAIQILLISAGVFGLFPLSGVVSPFLSYGRSAMIANFCVLGLLATVSSRTEHPARGPAAELRRNFRRLTVVLAAVTAVVIAKAVYVQGWAADEIAAKSVTVRQADGVRRAQQNPRLLDVIREMGRGTILDRNGLPLATSSWTEVVDNREKYRKIGIDISALPSNVNGRHYPLGGLTFHILGDAGSQRNWLASNSRYVERDMEFNLRGFTRASTAAAGASSGYRPVVHLLRHRFDPNDSEVRRIRESDRSLRLSLDAGLTVRLSEVLKRHLAAAGKTRGAVVVMNSWTGQVLALVNHPYPQDEGETDNDPEGTLFDRARFGLYPPGSVFKLVTSIAAIRSSDSSVENVFECHRLSGGRIGTVLQNAIIRDDVSDEHPHGRLTLSDALVVSCNAYFARLGVESIGAKPLFDTANLFDIHVASPNTSQRLGRTLAQAAFGQGEVLASPLQLIRVIATIANEGELPIVAISPTPDGNGAVRRQVIARDQGRLLAEALRQSVIRGTGIRASSPLVEVAGKTGTAQVAGRPSHSWFAGFAPVDAAREQRTAFVVFVENGGYGGGLAASISAELAAIVAKHDQPSVQRGNRKK